MDEKERIVEISWITFRTDSLERRKSSRRFQSFVVSQSRLSRIVYRLMSFFSILEAILAYSSSNSLTAFHWGDRDNGSIPYSTGSACPPAWTRVFRSLCRQNV